MKFSSFKKGKRRSPQTKYDRNPFLKGAFILSVASVLSRIIGAFYRVPLNRFLSPQIVGLYSYTYPIYTAALAVSSVGFPTAIAKMISARSAQKDPKTLRKFFWISVLFLGFLGFSISFLLYTKADLIAARIIGNKDAYVPLKAISPAIFFVTLMAVFRGFFQGAQQMGPYGFSLMIEQSFKAFFAIFLGFSFAPMGARYGAGGIAFGVTIGSIAGFLFILICFLCNRQKLFSSSFSLPTPVSESGSSLFKELLVLSFPITLGGLIIPLMSSVDVALLTRRMLLIPGMTRQGINELFAYYSSRASILINFPPVISTSLAASLVPAISRYQASKEFKKARSTAVSSLAVTLSIALPAAFGYFVLAEPIFTLLYGNSNGCYLLSVLSLSMVFLMLSQTLTGILNGMGHVTLPVKNLLIGIFLKSLLSFFLIPIPSLNIKGLAYASAAGYGITFFLDLLETKRKLPYPFSFSEISLYPLMIGGGMAVFVKAVYSFLLSAAVKTGLALFLSIGAGALFYALLSFWQNPYIKEPLSHLFAPKQKKNARKNDP